MLPSLNNSNAKNVPEDAIPEGEEYSPPPSQIRRSRTENSQRKRMSSYDPNQSRRSFVYHPNPNQPDEMMGPILRRKKVVSLPLGSDPRHAEFFQGVIREEKAMRETDLSKMPIPPPSSAGQRQVSSPGALERDYRRPSLVERPRARQSSHPPPASIEHLSFGAILRRKQVSLDLMAPEASAFFAPVLDDSEVLDLLAPGN